MPVPSSKGSQKNIPSANSSNGSNTGGEPLFDDEMLDLDETFPIMDETQTSPQQLKELRKRAEDILEQKRLEQELSDYDHWNDDWDE